MQMRSSGLSREQETYYHRCRTPSQGPSNSLCSIVYISILTNEVKSQPKLVLFLDEPTSGLDSWSAWAIVMVFRELADNGQAILCT